MNSAFPEVTFPELFFGFVAPIGTDLTESVNALSISLKSFGYKVVPIKVTRAFRKLEPYLSFETKLTEAPLQKRYESYIQFGNDLRAHFDFDAISALAAIQQILNARSFVDDSDIPGKTAYIITQFKCRDEVELLRTVYGRLFFQISVYSSRSNRVDSLARKFSHSNNVADTTGFRNQAEELVKIDENQVDHDYGQRVSEVFHEADFIVNTDAVDNLVKDQISRFVKLVFGSNLISPTREEYSMYIARSASYRSLDLSRQVGAAIFSPTAEIVTMGCNEVPAAPGGQYWCEKIDDRDYKRKIDSNDSSKRKYLLN